jgi:hypothetical protein
VPRVVSPSRGSEVSERLPTLRWASLILHFIAVSSTRRMASCVTKTGYLRGFAESTLSVNVTSTPVTLSIANSIAEINGPSGIIVDGDANTVMFPQASSLYFSTQGNGTCLSRRSRGEQATRRHWGDFWCWERCGHPLQPAHRSCRAEYKRHFLRFATHAPSERPSTRILPLPESPSIQPVRNALTGPGDPCRLSFGHSPANESST